MSRLEQFKAVRRLKRKFLISFFLFFLILFTGTCIADYSFNSLMKNKQSIGIFSIQTYNTYLEFSFLNGKIYINTEYIHRDWQQLKDRVAAIIKR